MSNFVVERNYKLILGAILALSAIIYFYRLGNDGLFTDEYLSLYVAGQSPSDIIFNHQRQTNPNTIPPLYVLLMHYWLKIVGEGREFAQRSLSAVFGILSVYFLYRISRLVFDIPTGLAAALFGALSFSWFSVFRQNRCYSLFVLLTLISFYIFFYFVKNRNSKYPLLFLIITNTLLLYTHYFAFLIILLQIFFGVLEYRKDKKGLMNILLMCLILNTAYLPWYQNFLYDINREPVITERISQIFGTKSIYAFLKILFSDFHFEWFPILTILYIPFIIRGIARLKRNFSRNFDSLSVYLVTVFGISFCVLYFITSSDRIRYYAPFMFPLLILLAYGMQGLNIKGRIKSLFFLSILSLIIINNVMDLRDFYKYGTTEEWKEAVELIKQTPGYKNKKNIFIFQTRYNPPVFSYYYWSNAQASHFVNNIVTREDYEKDIANLGVKEKIYVIEYMKGKKFFSKIDSFPDDAWIWIFRYHDRFFYDDFQFQNQNRYFFHRIKFKKEIPAIDVFLVKRILN
jgi:uncharacterized membrane protein